MARNRVHFEPRKPPVVGVRIRTSRHNALVDTGAAISFVAPEVVLKLGLPGVGTYPVVGVTGKQQTVRTVELPSVVWATLNLNPASQQFSSCPH